ncbi:protein BCL9 homolog isoform X2 [Drosophila hydei]|uniref:Protein BCL9 homolog isoform X2 n=1 Tax=Drosophila hydei TaxID=7224 RepID=A0A6J1LGI5_DROHY|nr:protein BCL9 homolog isoform X2 [Drosophila hydei]
MLSTITGGASQSTTTTTNADTAAKNIIQIEALKTVKVKAEPYSTLSPENANNQTNQIMSDEADAATKNNSSTNNNNHHNNNNSGNSSNNNNNSNNNNINNSKNTTNSNASSNSSDSARQNNANSPTNANPSSTTNPNNTSEQTNTKSNNNSNSSNIAQVLNSSAESELHQDELLKKKKINSGNTSSSNSVKEEDCVKPKLTSNPTNISASSALDKVNQNSLNSSTVVNNSNTKGAPAPASAVAAAAAGATEPVVKEEPTDILLGSCLVNMKKEDHFSPSMSPVGFGSIGATDRSVTPVKMELNEKPPSVMGLNTDNDISNCSALINTLDSDRIGDINASHANLSANPTVSVPGLGVSLGIGINVSPNAGSVAGGGGGGGNGGSGGGGGGGGGGLGGGASSNFMGNNSVGNCLDYMQQQNHIFVFSTQLANNGAESVLSGQFQTIIAYHCTQPATKSFLEDFFMKNPMKMNKLQRQNSLGLNICNMSGAGGPNWLNSNANSNNPNSNQNPNLAKMLQPQQQKSKAHFNNQADKRNHFADPTSTAADSLVNESDLMCWEAGNANRSSLEPDGQAMKLLEGVDSVLGKCNNADLSADGNIISLQGVKVPDENLTPQQRQHREEQLAKLKKMNQFLFPENESGGPAGNQLNKLPNEAAMGNLMMNIAPTGAASNAQMRQMQLQMQAAAAAAQQQQQQQQQQKTEHMSQLGEDVMMPLPADVIGDIGAVMSCSSGQKNNLPASNAAAAAATAAAGGAGGGGAGLGSAAGGFVNTNCVMGMGAGDKGEGSMTPMEWTKLQQQFFEERKAVGKAACRPTGGMPGPGSGTNPQPSITTLPSSSTPNAVLRNNVQGPPPPYHPTQRSASVPIATQSPNPSSPNNLSLPSPRTAGALGLPSNSPSMELNSTTNSSASGQVGATANMGSIATSKNCFQPDAGSPSSRHRNAGNNASNVNVCVNVMNNHLNSNPSTPLAHLSPKDLESFNSTAGDMKNTRPSPQRPRSPGNPNANANANSTNHLIEPNNMDSRFPATSPGINFNPHTHLQNNPNTALNTYKGANSSNPLERQNCGASGGPVQFGRRSDNMPLNPNSSSNRPAQNKMAQNFDPISSLAQMSQQLTSCVSTVGSPAGGMNMMGPGPGQGQVSGLVDINMEHSAAAAAAAGLVPNLDGISMEHMGNAPNNCHSINPLINSMGQRMLNPKLSNLGTASFSPGPNGMIRDGSGHGPGPGFHGILPPGARMMGRMPVNFGPNFNPNIQVKASTPNTIQYMPVRPQNNNSSSSSNSNNNNNNSNNSGNNGNVRVAPSLEFLQRYANPQMANPIGNDGNPMMMNMNSAPSDQQQNQQQQQQQQNKMINNHVGSMNFFQNCNQLAGLDDDVAGSVGLPGHADMTPMIRGMRPHGMRQHGGLGNIRLQAPTGNNIVNHRHQVQFPGGDSLDCNDPTILFNNGAGGNCNSPAMFAAAQQQQQQAQPKGQQQHIKSMPGGMCPSQLGMQGPVQGVQVQLQGQGHPGMVVGPNNSNLISSAGNGGGVNFVGPSSNDLKYAQQYHSFQQQLYATNTRSQQQQQQQQQQVGGNMIPMPPNLSPNPAFFVNK